MILAIDPGTTESAYCLIDDDYKPIEFGKVENEGFLFELKHELLFNKIVIEMVASYGMPVGREVFETCVWIGRFQQRTLDSSVTKVNLMYRKDVKMNLCNTTKAKDSNIIQALIDRFAYGVPNRGKGYKKSPGYFYGFKADIWQAYALGVAYLDKKEEV